MKNYKNTALARHKGKLFFLYKQHIKMEQVETENVPTIVMKKKMPNPKIVFGRKSGNAMSVLKLPCPLIFLIKCIIIMPNDL